MKPLHYAAAAVCLFAAQSARASLVLDAFTQFQGTGLGAVNTILTIQSPGNSSTESGCVGWNGTTTTFSNCGFVNSDVKTGASQTGTPTLAALNISSGSDIRVIFNALEPSGNAITLDNLVLQLYNAGGTSVFTSGAFAATSFASTAQGTGNAGFVFKLDTTQAAGATAAITGNGGTSNVHVGLGASASEATGGFETFFVASAATAIPEPANGVLFGSGLLTLIGAAIRRQRGKRLV